MLRLRDARLLAIFSFSLVALCNSTPKLGSDAIWSTWRNTTGVPIKTTRLSPTSITILLTDVEEKLTGRVKEKKKAKGVQRRSPEQSGPFCLAFLPLFSSGVHLTIFTSSTNLLISYPYARMSS